MVYINLFIGTSVLIFVSCLSMGLTEPQGRACYHAKICVHNAVEKCGIDSKGNLRRFFDSCDIKEYNCLKGTDFVKTTLEKCKSLTPLKDDHKKSEKAKFKPKVGASGKSNVNGAETKEINKGEEVKTNNRDEEDNNKDGVSKANAKRKLNVVLEEKEVSDVIEVYDEPVLKDDKENSGHKTATYIENDENAGKVNDDHNND